jgi:hypothetical protein
MLTTREGDDTKSKDSIFPAADTNEPINFATKSIGAAFKDALDYKKIQGFFVALENEAFKTAKAISNGIVANQDLIGETMFNLYKDNLKYGASVKDVSDFISEYGEQLGKIPAIQDEVITKAIIFSKATGLSTKEVAGFVGGMANIGIGQEKSMEKLNKIYMVGRRYGVDAAKLTGDVLKNISKASTYGFKDGIDGLTKMAARAQQLGISMENAMKFSQDVLDPDNAIETAASMQMLGGAVGALGDPFQLLYMAQNDVGALQEEMVKATESAVDFNATTGEFKIPVAEMYRLKEMAGKLGMSYEDISESAIKAAKQTQVLSMIELPSSFSEEDKNLVASLSEINKDGKVMIQIPGSKDMIDASTVSAEQLEKLREKADLEGKSAGQLQAEMVTIAQNQLSAQDKANISLEQIKMSLIFSKGEQAGGLKEYPDNLRKMAESANTMAGLTKGAEDTVGALDALDTAVGNVTESLSKWVNDPDKGKFEITDALKNLKNALTSAFPADSFGTAGTSGGGGGGTPLPSPIDKNVGVNDLFIGKSDKNKVVTGGFGEFYKLNTGDELLAMPNITELMSDANTAFESISNLEGNFNENTSESFINFVKNISSKGTEIKQSPNIQDLIGNNLDRLSEVGSTIVNQNITSSQKVEGNVGVDGNVNINVNIPNGLLSTALSSDREFQGALKDEIMKVVNYRLSEAYKKGQGNLS